MATNQRLPTARNSVDPSPTRGAHSNPADPRTDRVSLTIRDPPAGPIVDTAAPSTRGETGQRAPPERGGGGRSRDDSRILRLRSAGGSRRRPERPRGTRG